MGMIDTILKDNGIDLNKPIETIKTNLEDCIESICSRTIKINGWDMAHMHQETMNKSLVDLQVMYKQRNEESIELVKRNIKNLALVKSDVEKLESEMFYLSDKITRIMTGV